MSAAPNNIASLRKQCQVHSERNINPPDRAAIIPGTSSAQDDQPDLSRPEDAILYVLFLGILC